MQKFFQTRRREIQRTSGYSPGLLLIIGINILLSAAWPGSPPMPSLTSVFAAENPWRDKIESLL